MNSKAVLLPGPFPHQTYFRLIQVSIFWSSHGLVKNIALSTARFLSVPHVSPSSPMVVRTEFVSSGN